MYSKLKKFNTYLSKISDYTIIVTLAGMTIFTFLQVIFRYILKSSISWAEESAIYLFVWLTFIGAASAVRDHSHVRVKAFILAIKNAKIQKVIFLFAEILTGVFFVLLVFYGTKMSFTLISLKQSSPTMSFLNVAAVYLAIPIGCLFGLFHLVENIIEFINNESNEKES